MTSDATVPEESAAPVSQKFPFPLQDNETAMMVCRRHWIFLWPRTIFYTLLALVPLGIAIWLLSLVDAFDEDIVRWIVIIVAAIWLLYWVVKIFLEWYRYNNDLWVITNQRLVDSYKANPFNHRLSTADLVNLQDMTVERNGILQTTLNYGDVVCQTAGGERHDFRLSGIPRPQDVQLFVDRERDRERMRGR
jgi:hypothetical protein